MIHMRIDLHLTNMVNSTIDDNYEEIWKSKLQATRLSLRKFFSQFDEPIQGVVECTSFWYWEVDWCKENNIPKYLANAKVKTVKLDTKTLAELLRVGLIPEALMQKGNLRELTKARLRMV